MDDVKRVLFWWLCGSAGVLAYHIAAGWEIDWVVGVAVWGIAMGGLHIWSVHGSDRRAVLDMIVVAGPAAFFVGMVSALAIVNMIPATPALAAAIMSCIMVVVPYTTNGARAVRRLSPVLFGR